MKRQPFFVAGIWPFIVFPFLLLAIYTAFEQWHSIEADIETRTSQALQQDQIGWAKVNTFNFGRDVKISGTAPDGDSVNSAINLISSVEGVRAATFIGDVLELSPANLAVSLNGDIAEISGVINNQASVDSIIAFAKKNFSGKILNKLNVSKTVKPLANYEALLAAQLSQAGTITELKGDTLVARGAMPSEQAKADLLKKLRQSFNGKVIDQLTLDQHQICLTMVEDALKDNKINFATGNAIINQNSYGLLDNIAKIVKQCPTANFEISGHTDSTGNPEKNLELSQQRAQAVLDYLLSKHQVDNSRFSSKGYGATKPIADNDTDDGKALNRRIEFKLTSKI